MQSSVARPPPWPLNGHTLVGLDMAVLTDIYISTPADALTYDRDPRRFDGATLSAKGVTDLELSTLWCVCTGREWDVKLLDEFKHLMEEDGGERIIAELPNELVSHLANTDEQRLREVASAWAATEEISTQPANIEPYLRDLVALAKRASADSQRLYLWMCV
ncbi:MAG TPA: hypothetical protein VGR35_23050 [Tepidisphaeraceae bacterium]|nr:hypothetical protein [Tepidisphaeraceae bacterium]